MSGISSGDCVADVGIWCFPAPGRPKPLLALSSPPRPAVGSDPYPLDHPVAPHLHSLGRGIGQADHQRGDGLAEVLGGRVEGPGVPVVLLTQK